MAPTPPKASTPDIDTPRVCSAINAASTNTSRRNSLLMARAVVMSTGGLPSFCGLSSRASILPIRRMTNKAAMATSKTLRSSLMYTKERTGTTARNNTMATEMPHSHTSSQAGSRAACKMAPFQRACFFSARRSKKPNTRSKSRLQPSVTSAMTPSCTAQM